MRNKEESKKSLVASMVIQRLDHWHPRMVLSQTERLTIRRICSQMSANEYGAAAYSHL